MELQGKKIAFLGDSITFGAGTSAEEHIFWNVIARETGAETYGYGIGGTRIAKQRIFTPGMLKDGYYESRVDDMIPDADIVVVFGGTNDFGHGDAPFGCMEDRTADTFYGACHMLIRHLLERYPAAQLVFMTPLHRCSEDQDDVNEMGVRAQGKLVRYVDAIIEVCGWYGVPVLDLFRTCQIQPRVPVIRERYMPDGLHPNDAGHRILASRLISFLKTL